MEARTNMAIDNADMLRQLAEATRRAESLRQVIETISGELALEPLLTQIVESAVDLIEAQYGSIGLVIETESGPAVRIAAIYNMPASERRATTARAGAAATGRDAFGRSRPGCASAGAGARRGRLPGKDNAAA
jgi:GAF domain-containing protein